MNINGDFVLREIMGEFVLIPTNDTALQYNGIITVNPVGALIWKGLSEKKSRAELLQDILDEFDVSKEQADQDLEDFLHLLTEKGLCS